ncbi:MAG: DNA-deoxyinosine glycosylase [Oscillospiraceae bacterium]|nr:DNA-deoxyinosine glycosylase [Oscillospiraceae bacterium]
MESQYVRHPLAPVYDDHARVLLLGTMPSPKSREAGFYYAHPRNRFWPVLAQIFNEPLPAGIEARRAFCLAHGIALWDVLAACSIRGAGDSSIRRVEANPVERILQAAPVQAVFTTGRKAYDLYERYCLPKTGKKAQLLPSTSPANCACRMEELADAYKVILPYCLEEER